MAARTAARGPGAVLVSGLAATFVAVLLLLVAPAVSLAAPVLRGCGVDPIANTANVLCAAPSGPCNASSVRMTADIQVKSGGCIFDLGDRTLSIEQSFEMTGLGFITVLNAGDITITATGRLKARGDFVEPQGFIIGGGRISLTSSGVITMRNRGQIDVAGDGAGSVTLKANGANSAGVGIDLQAGSEIKGHGVSSFTDEGERFADGGSLDLSATLGSIIANANIDFSGANQAQGGDVTFRALRDITVGGLGIDASGGGGDGGDVDLTAGDNMVINDRISVDSRTGGGFGGTITLAAGREFVGSLVPGGSFTLNTNGGILSLNGSVSETFGGDGGDLDVSARGPLQFLGTGAFAIQANGGNTFDGFGGTIFLASTDTNRNRIGPLDGDLVLNGKIVATSGSTGGDGGVFEANAGRDYLQNSAIDVSGADTGGDFTGEAGGTATLNGVIDARGTLGRGDPGFVDFVAGLARGAGDSGLLTVGSIAANGGAADGSGQSITLMGCTLSVKAGATIDGSAGTSLAGALGGSDIELVGKRSVKLLANSIYRAGPGGSIKAVHLPGAPLVVESGVTFDPQLTEQSTVFASFPNCPVCGDGVRQLGETCDKGPTADGVCCDDTCTEFLCATPTPASSATPAATITPLRTATATATSSVTAPPATPTSTGATGTGQPTFTPAATLTPTPTLTPTVTGTPTTVATPTASPTATTTATVTPTLSLTATPSVTATVTVTATASSTATTTPSAPATGSPVSTPTLTPDTTPIATPTGRPNLADAEAAKTADKCQKAIKKAGAGFLTKKLASLAKCAGGVFKCIQTSADAAARQLCVDKIKTKCSAELVKITTAETKLRDGIRKACVTLPFDALRLREGVGYDALASNCAVTDLTSLAACITTHHECEVERLFAVQAPRAGELLRDVGVLAQTPCIADVTDGGAAGDPKTDGKVFDKCQAAITKAAAKFAGARFKGLAKCVDSVFNCVQTKPDPGLGPCLTLAKSKDTCVKEFAKIASAATALRTALGSRCGTILPGALAATSGLNFTPLVGECALHGVPALDQCAGTPAGNCLGSYADCVVRQHACHVDRLLRFEAPRVDELLALLQDPALALETCPSP